MPAVIVRQRKSWRRRDGVFLYFEAGFFNFEIVTSLGLMLFEYHTG